MEAGKIILIGGAPAIGKTFITKKLGRELGLPWISTDTIRDQMRKTIKNRDDFPELFNFERRDLPYMTSYLNSTPAQEIVNDINRENDRVWSGIVDFITEGSLGRSYIIEGMAITPKNVYGLLKNNSRVKAFFLIENNADKIREVIYTRGLWDSAYKYPDSLKEKELNWVILFNKWLIEESQKYNLPTVNLTGEEKDVDNIKNSIINDQ